MPPALTIPACIIADTGVGAALNHGLKLVIDLLLVVAVIIPAAQYPFQSWLIESAQQLIQLTNSEMDIAQLE
jgi:NADH:ubiquinone oxidoreductase subunit 5 (subunit L)/multisubunit Na+/H+ antiporter MnhA subunit